MASIDIQEYAGPRQDRLGLGLFIFHIVVSLYVLFGWVMPSLVYLVLLPLIGLQWRFNQGCCVINNFESWLRTGHWRDPDSKEEGTFLLMLCEWLGRVRPEPKVLDRTSYGTLTVLWLFGFGRFMWLAAA
ncbi:MAG: hypothetical protein EXR00_09010 [Alphaproteobacteria bacterium]|nr:hypothetical protein [Alphaproteobacteria bacterium]